MPPSSNRPSTEAIAVLEKIEELSLLRALTDRLATVADHGAACVALTEAIWEVHGATAVAYLSIDPWSGTAAVESVTPRESRLSALADPAVLEPLVTAILQAATPEPMRLDATARALLDESGVLLWAPTWLRGTRTGGLVLETEDADERVAADLRLLAIVAPMAALGLDAARSQAREDFLATLRHDIKNPVDAALGYIEMVDDGLAAHGLAELRSYLTAAHESLRAVDDLVGHYLQLGVIARARPLVGRAVFDLTALAAEVVERFRPAAARRGIELSAPHGSIWISADRRQLARVLTNLIDNAIKYMTGRGRVEVSVSSGEGEARLTVRDTGPGLSPQDVQRLFRKHTRLDPGGHVPGSGLGLYLSRAIVEAHGGSIEVSSAPGKGTTFVVRLPASAAARSATLPAASAPPA